MTDASNAGSKVDCSSLTVGANTVFRQRFNVCDPTVATGLMTVGATNAALSETALAAARTASHLFALDAAGSAGSQQVPLLVESTAQPNLKTSLWFLGVEASVKTTVALSTDAALVVGLQPLSTAAGTVVAGTVAAKSWLAGVQWLNYASTPALTTAQGCAAQGDSNGVLKTAVMPAGTAIYAGASSGGAASATATLTIPAAKMGYLDGFDVDGLGATAGAAIDVTIVGTLGGTLTYKFGVPAGATVPVHQSFKFNPPLQASAVATNLVVAAASFGTGNTASSVNAYGHYV